MPSRPGFARSILCAVFVTVALCPVAWPQLRVDYDGSLSTEKGADLSEEIQLGTPPQREGLLKNLGVDPVFVNEAATAVPHAELRINPVDGTDANLLFLPCGGPGSPQAHFYLLRPGQDQHWHTIDRVHLDCWWQPTSYEWLQIQGKPRPSLLTHHVNHGHGSGVVEDDMQLFEVRGDHLVKVLETEEYMSQVEMGTTHSMLHASTLLPFPDGSLEETRITSDRDESDNSVKPVHIALAERRRWRWIESSKSYTPGKFAIVHP